MSETNGEREEGGGSPLDMEAEFAKIVEAYGDQPAATSPPATPEGLTERFKALGWADAPGPAPAGDDALNTDATYYDEGHFIPPEPPPIAVPEPRRLIAWGGVLGSPLVMLIFVVFQLNAPDWLAFFLVSGFVGGFVYLVATMKRDDDRWPGDDGAVL